MKLTIIFLIGFILGTTVTMVRATTMSATVEESDFYKCKRQCYEQTLTIDNLN